MTDHPHNGRAAVPNITTQRFAVTRFADKSAQKLTVSTQSLVELRELVLSTSAKEKDALPLLKLARFGSKRTQLNCLRSDANVLDISGIEIDYDKKKIPFEDAVALIERARLNALIYTSPSYTKTEPKWRVVLPTSVARPPADRAKLVARVNGVLGGVVAPESFTLSQSYYFGSVSRNPDHRAILIDGDPIDLRSDLDATAIGKAGAKPGNGSGGFDPDERLEDEVLINRIITGENFHGSLVALAARYIMRGATGESTVVALQTLMDRSTAPQDARWQARYDSIPATVASAVEYGRRKLAEEEAATAALDAAAHDEALHAKIMAELEDSDESEPAAGESQPHKGAQSKANEAIASFILSRASNGAGAKQGEPKDEKQQGPPKSGLGEWNAGDDNLMPPPRGWLLGIIFARKFMSSLLADGGVGKTALRYAQLISCATGRALTGDHVFQRARVLIISLEDDADELRRRILALLLHYKIDRSEVDGWLFLSAPGANGGKLMMMNRRGQLVRGTLADQIEVVIKQRNIDIVSIDPFVKSHSVDENSNSAIDDVVQVLTDLAAKCNIAVDAPHHTSKGLADPGNASRGRGASAMKDGGRLVYTLAPMSPEEAKAFGVKEEQRRLLIRMDSGKVNITPPLASAKWFRLVGVKLGNATLMYPHGDEVQTVEPWTAPATWEGLSNDLLNRIRVDLDAGLPDGNRYTDAAKAGVREAWRVVARHAPDKTEAQAREIIKVWLKNGVLVVRPYFNQATKKTVNGLFVAVADDTM
jgi:RecA-family ATPase